MAAAHPSPDGGQSLPSPAVYAPSTFTPLKFRYQNAYGWTNNRAPYNIKDVPNSYRDDPSNMAYEWYRYSEIAAANPRRSNPPFSSDAAGRLMNTVHVGVGGEPARILRGFIRRAEYDVSDAMSMGRLYFMYNPSIIARDYVSYLDQGALDPFNTVFQSENLVAPPSMMNFTFELFFDRQDEAREKDNPGVLVDMEFFDMVVRNVIPVPSLQAMPDNGVMMVNPRDITVVFSPEITVQGRPLNASIVYEKFTHRMTPTRMRIQLTMRVIYWGPQRESTTYSSPAAEAVAAAVVSYANTAEAAVNFTWSDLESTATGVVQEIIDLNLGFTRLGSAVANSSALKFAEEKVAANATKYDRNKRNQLWEYADCSSLVWGAFAGVGQATALGWPAMPASGSGVGVNIPATWTMWEGFKSSTAVEKIWGFAGDTDKNAGAKKMQAGDIIIRVGSGAGDDHIAIVAENTDSYLKVFHAMSPSKGCGHSTYSYPVSFDYDCGVRPLTLGGQGAAAQNNDRTNL